MPRVNSPPTLEYAVSLDPSAAALLAHVGRVYDGGHALILPDDIIAYADATGDEHIRYYGEGAIAPPMFHVRPMRDLLFLIMEDPALQLDMLRLVHAGHDARFHQPLRAGDLIHIRGKLTHIEQKAKGVFVEGEMAGFVDGRLAISATTSFFVRGQMLAPVGTGHRAQPAPNTPSGAPTGTRTWRVRPDQSYRYAEASLDRNPIHLDPEVARAGGLPDVILHGLCTMAMTGRTILESVGNSDPLRLQRLGLRWARPVTNGSTLTTRMWVQPADEAGLQTVLFDVVDTNGVAVVTSGIAEVKP